MIWPSGWPTEPPGLSDEEWWEWESKCAEREARPTYEDMMAMEDSGYMDAEVV